MEGLWPWIEAGVPAPIAERGQAFTSRRARAKLRMADLWFEDLRHVFEYMAADEGVEQSKTQIRDAPRNGGYNCALTRAECKRDVEEAVGEALKGRKRV